MYSSAYVRYICVFVLYIAKKIQKALMNVFHMVLAGRVGRTVHSLQTEELEEEADEEFRRLDKMFQLIDGDGNLE